MSDPAVLEAKERVELIGDPCLADSGTPRSARVEVVLKDGQTLSHFTPQPLGSWQNPMSIEDVNTKARDLLEPVLGTARTEAVIRG